MARGFLGYNRSDDLLHEAEGLRGDHVCSFVVHENEYPREVRADSHPRVLADVVLLAELHQFGDLGDHRLVFVGIVVLSIHEVEQIVNLGVDSVFDCVFLAFEHG